MAEAVQSRCLRWLCWLCTVLLCVALPGGLLRAQDWLAAGQVPAADRALLLLVIDSDLPLGRIVLRREGGGLLRLTPRQRAAMHSLPPDALAPEDAERRVGLLALPPGDWQLLRIEAANASGDRGRGRGRSVGALPLTPELRRSLRLQAGRISYPGDLRLTETPASQHIDAVWQPGGSAWLERLWADHALLLQAWPLTTLTPLPDAFPAHWLSRRAALAGGSTAADGAAPAVCHAAHRLVAAHAVPALPAQELARLLLRPPALVQLSLSPHGDWLAIGWRQGQRIDLHLHQVSAGAFSSWPRQQPGLRLSASSRLDWCGPACLAISSGRDAEASVTLLRPAADGVWQPRRLPRAGVVVDPLPLQPEALLFAATDAVAGRGGAALHRLELAADAAATAPGRLQPLSAADAAALGWLADEQGRPRLALVRDEAGHALLPLPLSSSLAGAAPARLLQRPLLARFDPLAIVDDALLALDDHALPALSLRRFPLDGAPPVLLASVGDLIDSAAPADAAGVLLGFDRRPLALRYRADGLIHSVAIAPAMQTRLQALARQHDQAAIELARVALGEQVWLYRSDQAGDAAAATWWLQRSADLAPQRIGRLRPWLACDDAVEGGVAASHHCRDGLPPPLRSESLHWTSRDGWPLQAFLTLPPAAAGPLPPLPLVLLPHGGPLGVADDRHYDAWVHGLARQFVAVLQVNYRGSDGQGRGFREAALGQVGGGIEADLEEALQRVLADPRIDAGRVCAVGTSYGGYSALLLASRQPERFRCVAALAAPSDLTLRFASADWAADPLQRALQARLYGDPIEAADSLRARSPLYRAEFIRAAVLLGHGQRDRRVSSEHSARMALMLRTHGQAVTEVVYPAAAHGLSRLDDQIDWFARVQKFLSQHLSLNLGQPRKVPAENVTGAPGSAAIGEGC